MDLKQLQYFVVSVDSGSFKKAAEVLYTSQPHISKTIKSLETELRVDLLERKARGVEATEAGKKVYEYACRILVESGKIKNIREIHNHHELCIVANPNDYLTDIFQSFYMSELAMGLRAQYLEEDMEGILHLLHHHRAELGFVFVHEKQMMAFKQELEKKRLEFSEIGRTGPLLFAGPNSPLYHAASVTNKELRDLNYVQTKDDQDFLSIHLIDRDEDYQYHKRRGQVLVTNSRHLMLQIIQESGLCSISCGLLKQLTDYEEIHGIPIRGSEESISFGYVKRTRDELSAAAKRLLTLIQEKYKGWTEL